MPEFSGADPGHGHPVDLDAETAAQRYRRRRAHQMTAEQRLELFRGIQRRAVRLLKASPQAYQHFLRRNYRKRRASNATCNTTLPDIKPS